MKRFRDPSPESPHYPFWKHLASGGTVHRKDTLNNVEEDLTLEGLGGDANEIIRFGYMDLTIVNRT